MVVCQTVDRNLVPWFESTYYHFETLAMCLLLDTNNLFVSFYQVAMPGEVKDPTQGINV